MRSRKGRERHWRQLMVRRWNAPDVWGAVELWFDWVIEAWILRLLWWIERPGLEERREKKREERESSASEAIQEGLYRGLYSNDSPITLQHQLFPSSLFCARNYCCYFTSLSHCKQWIDCVPFNTSALVLLLYSVLRTEYLSATWQGGEPRASFLNPAILACISPLAIAISASFVSCGYFFLSPFLSF